MPFDVNVPVSGDIVIGIWFGAYNLGQRLHSRPAAAYAFHTAWFEDRQVERVTMHQMDAADPALFPPGGLACSLSSKKYIAGCDRGQSSVAWSSLVMLCTVKEFRSHMRGG